VKLHQRTPRFATSKTKWEMNDASKQVKTGQFFFNLAQNQLNGLIIFQSLFVIFP